MGMLNKITAALRGLGAQNRYDAAGTGRRMRGWTAPSTGPNKAIAGLQNIRNRSRDAARNDWSGESATQKWVSNLVGIGITPRVKRFPAGPRKRRVVDLWDRWVQQSDADGALNFYGQQALVVRAWLDSGEVFARKRVRTFDSGMEVPLQVQLIEAEFVPLMDADNWPGMPVGNKIRQGIELDRRGQRVAYWMHRDHPGDGMTDTSRLLRIPAAEVLHIYEVKRPGQLRGVSALAPVLARLRSLADYDDAVLERQKIANLFAAFITRGVGGDGDTDPLTNLPMDFASDGSALAGLQPGIMQELDYGQDIKFANPPEAGTTYSDYVRTQHLGTAAASGMPYEIFSGDIREVSDRTLRVLINEFRRFAEQRQWHTIIPMFCQPVRQWWTDASVLAGHVTAEEAPDVSLVEWAPHGWAHIHPVQDPQGKKLEVEAGFRSRSSVIGERGDDPDMVDAERAADKAREDALGLTEVPVAPGAAPAKKPETEDDGIDNDEYSAPPNPTQAQQREMHLALVAVAAGIQAAAAKEHPAPVVNVAAPVINVGGTEVHNHLPEQAAQPAPVVNVAAPVVSVEAPQVHNHMPEQSAPEVHVHNEVQAAPAVQKIEITAMPTRETTTRIERDSKDNILKTIQTERDE